MVTPVITMHALNFDIGRETEENMSKENTLESGYPFSVSIVRNEHLGPNLPESSEWLKTQLANGLRSSPETAW